MKLNTANIKNETKIHLSCRGLKPCALWECLVGAQVARLQHLGSIQSATVTLERQTQIKPGFRVMALLEVPGPDYHAEAADYTLRAALLKVADSLREQMLSRKNRQLSRRKDRLALMNRPT
jgi:hypothetical protein